MIYRIFFFVEINKSLCNRRDVSTTGKMAFCFHQTFSHCSIKRLSKLSSWSDHQSSSQFPIKTISKCSSWLNHLSFSQCSIKTFSKYSSWSDHLSFSRSEMQETSCVFSLSCPISIGSGSIAVAEGANVTPPLVADVPKSWKYPPRWWLQRIYPKKILTFGLKGIVTVKVW